MIGNPYKGRSFGGLIRYLFEGRQGERNPHRVEWYETRNLSFDDPDLMPKIMRATARQSTQVDKPVYHLPISWPSDEKLDRATQVKIAEQLIADLGLSEHQVVIIAHNDGDCPHIHLVINRVHPETGRAWDAWRDVYRIMDSLERQERELGLRIVDRSQVRHRDRERGATREERQRAAREGDVALVPWSEADMRGVRTAVTKHFRDARSWSDLEARLEKHGLTLRRTGQARARGFRVTDGKKFMTLSKIGKHARWSELEQRFGASWDEHEATRPLSRDEQRSLEPPDALTIMRGAPAAPPIERERRLIEAWRAHRAWQSDIDKEHAVVNEARKLGRAMRAWRSTVWKERNAYGRWQIAKEKYEILLGRIYRDPVSVAARIREELRSDKNWADLDLRKIGRLRGAGALKLMSQDRKEAVRLTERIPRAFMRQWKLESRAQGFAEDQLRLKAIVDAQERLYRDKRDELGHRTVRRLRREDLEWARREAVRVLNVRDIEKVRLHEPSKAALMALFAEEQARRQQRLPRMHERGTGWDR